LVRKIIQEKCQISDYFPDYKTFQMPKKLDQHLIIDNENEEVTRTKFFILDMFIKITNEPLRDAFAKVAQYESSNHNNNNINNNDQQLITKPDAMIKLNVSETRIRYLYKNSQEECLNGKFCIPYFTCAVDTNNMKRVFRACSSILKKAHLEKSGLI
jgi:hypothetical protein